MNYAIDDEHGNRLTAGLQEHNAHAIAQRMADERDEPVYLYATGDDKETAEAIEFQPSRPQWPRLYKASGEPEKSLPRMPRAPEDALAWKYNDDVSEAHWVTDESELRQLRREDAPLSYTAAGLAVFGIEEDNMSDTAELQLEVIFDNGGGITVQTATYTHTYDRALQAAMDTRLLLDGASTQNWDGNNPQDRIEWTAEDMRNGGYRVYDAEALRNPVTPENAWFNEADFLAAFREATNAPK